MAVLAVQFPHFLKRFVFCQSEAHFASPWQTKGYFLLGLNICGSQIKEWAPRESFEFQQLVGEGVLCLSSQVLKRLCFLNWRRKSAEKGKWSKELKVHFIWGAFSILPSALLPQAELVVFTFYVHLISYLGKAETGRPTGKQFQSSWRKTTGPYISSVINTESRTMQETLTRQSGKDNMLG